MRMSPIIEPSPPRDLVFISLRICYSTWHTRVVRLPAVLDRGGGADYLSSVAYAINVCRHDLRFRRAAAPSPLRSVM